MHTIKGEPRLSAKGHEVFAEMHAESASDLRRAAAEQPESPDAPELLALAAGQDGASKGHRFRAEELRYDARGGMTEAQARAAREARAEACGELVDAVQAALAAGVPFPVVQWSRDDMAEEQEETWNVVADEIPGTPETAEIVAEVFRRADARSRLLGLLETRAVDAPRYVVGVDSGVQSTAVVRIRIADGVVVACETWDEPRKGDGR